MPEVCTLSEQGQILLLSTKKAYTRKVTSHNCLVFNPCLVYGRKNTLATLSCVFTCLTSKFKSFAEKLLICQKLHCTNYLTFFSKTTFLHWEPFIKMFYTINNCSPLLVTKSVSCYAN